MMSSINEHVIDRLRASKMAYAQAEYDNGHTAGIAWAQTEDAEYAHLRSLALFNADVEWEVYGDHNADDMALQHVFWQSLAKSGRSRWDSSHGFWWTICGDGNNPSEYFVRGFVEGVAEFFEEVEARL